MFLDLVPAASVQGGLFDTPDTQARQRLKGFVDRLNARHGRDTISFAVRPATAVEAAQRPLHDELGGVTASWIERSD